jgi:hypothetical protein
MATPTSPSLKGTAIVYGTNTYTGVVVTSFDAESAFENKDLAANETGETISVRHSSGVVNVTIEGFVKTSGFSAVQPGNFISYNCGEVADTLSNILLDSVTIRGEQKGWRRVSLKGTAYENISA